MTTSLANVSSQTVLANEGGLNELVYTFTQTLHAA